MLFLCRSWDDVLEWTWLRNIGKHILPNTFEIEAQMKKEKELSIAANQRSIIHQAEIRLRKLVSVYIKEFRGRLNEIKAQNVKFLMKRASKRMGEIRKQVLKDYQEGKLRMIGKKDALKLLVDVYDERIKQFMSEEKLIISGT
mmetsp:Transcript_22386/g.33349  ORF Transcript_22386/g.33349 Transcript_22386/m.33349 type:complete len:143 (+) Transcript_22386:665-1093(+)